MENRKNILTENEILELYAQLIWECYLLKRQANLTNS
jgi:hypothetical protein